MYLIKVSCFSPPAPRRCWLALAGFAAEGNRAGKGAGTNTSAGGHAGALPSLTVTESGGGGESRSASQSRRQETPSAVALRNQVPGEEFVQKHVQ